MICYLIIIYLSDTFMLQNTLQAWEMESLIVIYASIYDY